MFHTFPMQLSRMKPSTIFRAQATPLKSPLKPLPPAQVDQLGNFKHQQVQGFRTGSLIVSSCLKEFSIREIGLELSRKSDQAKLCNFAIGRSTAMGYTRRNGHVN